MWYIYFCCGQPFAIPLRISTKFFYLKLPQPFSCFRNQTADARSWYFHREHFQLLFWDRLFVFMRLVPHRTICCFNVNAISISSVFRQGTKFEDQSAQCHSNEHHLHARWLTQPMAWANVRKRWHIEWEFIGYFLNGFLSVLVFRLVFFILFFSAESSIKQMCQIIMWTIFLKSLADDVCYTMGHFGANELSASELQTKLK